MSQVIFKAQKPELFQKYWEQYSTKWAVSPRYTTLALDNFLEMSTTPGFLLADKSFVLIRESEVVACVFLPLEKAKNHHAVSFNGHYVIAPLFKDDAAAKEAFTLIDQIAVENKVAKIMFAIDALEHSNYPYNFLLRFDYLNTSLLNYLIDLALPGDLLSHCRKGHRSDIKKIENNPDFEILMIDADRPDYAIHEAYRELHRLAAGRVTRSKASFESQFAKLKAGLAAVFAISYQGKIIAASYFESHGQKVLYGSAAENPIYGDWPLYHSMVFAAMKYYQRKGYRWIEVSQPFNPSTQFDYEADQKRFNIGRFKRGFGGFWVNDFRGIKYFDREIFSLEVGEFKNKYERKI